MLNYLNEVDQGPHSWVVNIQHSNVNKEKKHQFFFNKYSYIKVKYKY